MKQLQKEIEQNRSDAFTAIQSANTHDALEQLRVAYLGRKGAVTLLLKSLKDLDDDEKRKWGPKVQTLKTDIEGALEQRIGQLEEERYANLGESEWHDITEPGSFAATGHLHPLTQTQEDVEDAFTALGFSVVETPELESEYYNFEALNVPAHHPARDMQDTFWLEKGFVMRTHTTSFQARMIEAHGTPLRVVQAGRCFRYEATDASHDDTFYQVDGLMIDEHVTAAHLVGVIESVLSSVFGKKVDVRLRPGYFPFVEPGMELDFKCLLCAGKGCRVCKHSGWLEFMGCGMVHPNVLKAGNVDPSKYSGFAFGFGLSRLAMMRYGITDVRHLMSSDLRFLRQF